MDSFDELHEDRHDNGWLILVAVFVVGLVVTAYYVIPEVKSMMVAKNIPQLVRGLFYGPMLLVGGGIPTLCAYFLVTK